MKKSVFTLILMCILLPFIGEYKLTAQSTVGTDFWVTFLPNSDGESIELSLIATGKRDCTGTISNPNTGWDTAFTVISNDISTIKLSSFAQACNYNASDKTINTALHIISTDSISLYASNFKKHTFDVTNVLPTNSLGSEYILQTYSGTSEFSIIATEDNTTVNINLSNDSQNGHYANQMFSITLNSGECYQILSEDDLSGTHITTNNDKNIAVFAGNLCASIPSGKGYCDHIVEQMIPTVCWGNKFVVTNSQLRDNDKVKITSLNDNCTIKKDGALLTTLNAKQTYEFEITSNTPAIYLESTEPISVYLYFTGSTYGGENGDPSMVTITPIEQRIDNITFSTFNSGTSEYHYVNIITDTENSSAIMLDGSNITNKFKTVSGNTNYSYARIEISHGPHTISSSNNGFIAHVYGLGDDESYSYSVGSMAKNLTSQMYVNGLSSSDNPDGFFLCDKDVSFELNLNFNPSDVLWNFGDGKYSNGGTSIHHIYDSIGKYEVSCDIYAIEEEENILVRTIYTTLHIGNSYFKNISDLICQGDDYLDYNFNIIAPFAGVHIETQFLNTIYGCDSIIELNLTVVPTYITHITDSICNGDDYTANGFNIIKPSIGVHLDTLCLNSLYGCDSTVFLNLNIIEKYDDLTIDGLEDVLVSSDLITGYYKYTCNLYDDCYQYNWSISNQEWHIYPNLNECTVLVTSPIKNALTVSAENYCGIFYDTIDLNAEFITFEENNKKEVSAFPNPAKDFINIQYKDIIRINIYNSQGHLVLRQDYNYKNKVHLDLSSLENSIYIMEVITADKTISKLISIIK